ncbi:hypothetical protein NL676_036912 [Syzygium grande]|nr:hypothetical protein NL676_036912 [Syzygium grande]
MVIDRLWPRMSSMKLRQAHLVVHRFSEHTNRNLVTTSPVVPTGTVVDAAGGNGWRSWHSRGFAGPPLRRTAIVDFVVYLNSTTSCAEAAAAASVRSWCNGNGASISNMRPAVHVCREKSLAY